MKSQARLGEHDNRKYVTICRISENVTLFSKNSANDHFQDIGERFECNLNFILTLINEKLIDRNKKKEGAILNYSERVLFI